MKPSAFLLTSCAVLLATFSAAGQSSPSVTPLYSFARSANGINPTAGLIRGTDGNFYGTTSAGGTAGLGTVFQLTPTGGYTTLHSFTGANGDGARPQAALLRGRDGNFYGTTRDGGVSNSGTVFRLDGTGAYTVLYSFEADFSVMDGTHPLTALIQGSDGNFYGTTLAGGSHNGGTAYQLTPDGKETVLYSFPLLKGGAAQGPAYASLVQAGDGNFYCTTQTGRIFQLTPAGGLKQIYGFSGYDDGSSANALTLGPDGNLYGTTPDGGGQSYAGTIFRLTTSGEMTVLYAFSHYAGDGAYPHAQLSLGSDGNFYGTTSRGGANDDGLLFKITPSGTLTNLYSFTTPNVSTATLVEGIDGKFYGTSSGGAPGGQAYAVDPVGSSTVFYTFNDFSTDGFQPNAGLALGNDGNLYGTTSQGGTAGLGTVFRFTPAGALTTLYSFTGTNGDGSAPVSAPVQGSDGNLYGTTPTGGTGGVGTVYRLTPAGALTILHSFTGASGEGASPLASLVQGSDGNFYGTTSTGGNGVFSNASGTNPGYGTVFRITPAGALSTLHAFDYANDGLKPLTALTPGSDGNFYGTTSVGGSGGGGVAFVLTPGGALTVLFSFGGGNNDGYTSEGTLVQGSDGNFYGTTFAGGGVTYNGIKSDDGTTFSLTPAGKLTTLFTFDGGHDGADGAAPTSGLVQASDGNFYGTTSAGTGGNAGTLFQLVPGGALKTIYTFDTLPGAVANPKSALVQGSDGNLYGTTSAGGANDAGTIYRVNIPSTANEPTVTLTVATPSVAVGSGTYGEFLLTLSAAQDSDLFVNYTVKGSGTNGTDYLLLKGRKKIKAGKTTKPIKVLPLGDLDGEAKKTVVLLLAPGEGYKIGTIGKLKVKITR